MVLPASAASNRFAASRLTAAGFSRRLRTRAASAAFSTLTCCILAWVVYKRYSEFRALSAALAAVGGAQPPLCCSADRISFCPEPLVRARSEA